MKITLRLFAILRDRFDGQSEMDLTIRDGATAGEVESMLLAASPELATLLARSALAVNQEYVPRDTPLKDGDEVAIIPPVSGG